MAARSRANAPATRGYSGTPLTRKLGLAAGQRVAPSGLKLVVRKELR